MGITTQFGQRSLRVDYESDGCFLGTLDDILITVWTRTPRAEHVARVAYCLKQLALEHGCGSGVSIAVAKPGLPDRAAREAMTELAREYADRTIGSAVVLSGNGFWASMLQTLATSIYHLGSMRSRYKQRVCSNVGDAARWLAAVHSASAGKAVSPADLEAAMVFMRDRALAYRLSLSRHRP